MKPIKISEFIDKIGNDKKGLNKKLNEWYAGKPEDFKKPEYPNFEKLDKAPASEQNRIAEEFIKDSADVGTIIGDLIDDIYQNVHKNDNTIDENTIDNNIIREVASWIFSLRPLADVFEKLNDSIKTNCELVLEARFERLERADVVLVGTKNKQPVIIIIENKRWSNLKRYKYYGENTVWDPVENKPVSHPSRQAYRHRTILEDHNLYVQDNIVKNRPIDKIPIYAFVYMINGKKCEKSVGPFNTKFGEHLKKAPIFSGEEANEIRDYIENRIDYGKIGLAEDIYINSKVHDSDDFIKSSLETWKISKEKLNKEQIILFDEIFNKVISDSEDKSVYIIKGKTGTGKTFLANTLLHKLYEDNKSRKNILARYIEKNRAPRIYQKTIFNMPEDLMYCTVPTIPDGFQKYDCLICDETHRMPKFVMGKEKEQEEFIEKFIENSKISIFFLDENQHVHVNDFVKEEYIIGIAEKCFNLKMNESIFVHELTLQERCPSARYYLEVLENLLINPSLEKPLKISANNKYEVKLVDNRENLIKIIKDKNDKRQNHRTSRVVSGKGLGAKWKCYLKGDKIFATDEESANIIGNIDTCQGLDFEYIGVIIESDLVYNKKLDIVFSNKKSVKTAIKIKMYEHQHDDYNISARLTKAEKYTLKKMPHGFPKKMKFIRYLYMRNNHDIGDIKKIILNTYHVLLTRGAKGCYIYCRDKDLQDYLMNDIGFPLIKGDG